MDSSGAGPLPDARVHVVFEDQVRRAPDRIAIEEGELRITYRELDERANALAHELVRAGAGHETLVGLCATRSIDTLVGILATLKAGAAYLPLDPGYPAERLGFMLDDARIRVLLAQPSAASRLPPHQARTLLLGGAARAEAPPRRVGSGESLAYVMYTSGSTGRPKGVLVPHRAIVRLVRGATYASFSPDEVFLHLAPMSFDASTFEIWGALLNGGRVAVVPALHPSLQEIGEAIRRHEVTTLWLTAGLFHLMVNERLEDLRPLRQLLSGGDVLSVAHCRRVLRELPEVALINGYGPTETTTFACCHRVREPIGPSVPIGTPIHQTSVHLLDERGAEVPEGDEGELYIGGAGVARGYLDRPELTAERFVDHPRLGRLYRTGDRARRLPDGALEFHGRLDGQVKLRGFRIELGEIETLLAQHPRVREAAADVREPRPGDKRLWAWFTGEATAAELRAFLAGRLPDHMVPSALQKVEALPLGATGKVDRRALPDIALAQAQQGAVGGGHEQLIAGIWKSVLGLPQVGPRDNFFEIGGNSLHLIEVHERLERALARPLPVTRLFQFPTVESLAQHLQGGEQASFASAVQDRAAKQRAAAARAQAAKRRP